MIQKLKYVRMK